MVKDTTRPAEESGDVGGIPATLNQGVDHASDRKSARQDGAPDPDAATGAGAALSNTPESPAIASRGARDKTGPMTPAGSATGARRTDAGTPPSGGKSADGDASGQDDTVAESIGKSIAAPFKSD